MPDRLAPTHAGMASVFPLTLNESGAARSAPPAGIEPVATWLDSRDVPAVVCYSHDDQRWIVLPGLASFRFGQGPGPVQGFVGDQISEKHVLDRYHRVVLPLVCQAFGNEVLHASAVLTSTGVVAFCGPSGAGKSTLAYALGQRGHPVAADDSVVLTVAGSSIDVLALPFALRLLAPSRNQLGVDDESSSLLRAEDDVADSPLRAICMIEPSHTPDRDLSVDQIAGAEAFRALLAHALCFSIKDVTRTAEMLRNYLNVAAQVPVYHVRIRREFESLERVAGQLGDLWR